MSTAQTASEPSLGGGYLMIVVDAGRQAAPNPPRSWSWLIAAAGMPFPGRPFGLTTSLGPLVPVGHADSKLTGLPSPMFSSSRMAGGGCFMIS